MVLTSPQRSNVIVASLLRAVVLIVEQFVGWSMAP